MTNWTLRLHHVAAVVGVVGLLQVGIAPSHAAVAAPTTVSIVNGELRVIASPGRNSDLSITPNSPAGKVSVESLFRPGEFVTDAPCEVKSVFTAECPQGSIVRIRVDLGDGHDHLTNLLDVPGVIMLGSGNDGAGFFGASAQKLDLGAGDDRATLGGGAANVVGGPGMDEVLYGDKPVTVRLDDLANDGPSGARDNVHSDIENLRGSSGDDVLIGSDAGNQFIGRGGRDKIDGRGGNDVFVDDVGSSDNDSDDNDDMIGGPGIDTIDYDAQGRDVVVTLDNRANDGVEGFGSADNVHTDVENVLTGGGNDTVIGSSANNVLRSGTGRDILSGGAGNDVLDGGDDEPTTDWLLGGSGVDTVTYSARIRTVSVSIDDVPNDGGPGERDNVLGDVENVLGGSGNDVLSGSAAGNILRGLGGNDVLNGLGGNDSLEGGTGKDVLFGSTGVDTATYQTHPVGVAVTLDNNANDGRSNEADNVRADIENVSGSNFADTVVGSPAANVLRGLAGNDRLFGRAGNDRLIGDSGNDQGFGDAGSDVCTTERKTSCP